MIQKLELLLFKRGNKMKNDKIRQRIIYCLMTVILLVQAFMPLTAVAQMLPTDWMLGTLSQKDDQLLLKISGANEKQATLHYSNELNLTAVKWQSGKTEPALTLDNSKKEIIIAPSTADYADTLIMTGTPNFISALKSEVAFSYGNQKATLPLTDETQATSSSASFTTTETSQTTTPASTAADKTNSSTTADTKENTKPTTSQPTASKSNRMRAAVNNDIRTYFPSGSGTIITDSHILYTDQDGQPLEPPIPADATVRLTYDWAIPEDVRQQIKAGDFFEFHLPAELVPNREMSGELKDSDGTTYATYFVGKDGTVRFTFTEDVTKASDITGDFYFESHFETSHIDGPGDITIHYPTEDNLPPVDVIIRPATETEIDKQGHFDRTPNPSKVQWTVDINHAMKENTNLTVTEKWPTDIAYDSVTVHELVMNLDGTVKEVGRTLAPSEYTVDKNGNVTVNGKTNKAYRLTYQSTIEESAIPDKGGKVHFENEAILTSDELPDEISAKATVTNNYGKLIEKNQAGYDAAKQEFSWNIKYNYGEKNIAKDSAVLTDTMSDNLTLDEDSLVVHRILFDKNGKEIIGATLVSPTDYTVVYDKAKNQFVLQFAHDLNYAVKIDYKTKVNGLVTENTAVDNKVVVDTGGDGQEGGDDGTALQQNIIKNLGKVDYANKTVDWSLEVNKNNYDLKNAVITDTFNPAPGLLLQRDHTTETGYKLTIETTEGKHLFATEDYELKIQKNEHNQQTGFTIALKGAYAQTNDAFIIRYTTEFDVSDLDPDGQTGPDSFLNHAGIDWQDKWDNAHHSEDEKPFRPHDPFSLNAEKSGTYNPLTKEITWTIAVNLSANQLQDAQLQDKILANQNYIKGSVAVYNAQTEPDGTVHIDEKNDVTKELAVTEPTEKNDQTLTVKFPQGVAQTYAIRFKTSLANQVIDEQKEYDNVAEYINHGDKRDVTGQVAIQHGGESVKKDGLQDPDDPNYVLWHLMINGAQSTLDDVTITDEPSINQVLDEDSVAVYQTKVAADGTIVPDKSQPLTVDKDYTVTITTDNETGQQKLVVQMKHIETAYYMEYRSLILSSATGNEDKVSNHVAIKGTGSKVVDGGDGADVTVKVDNSGGNASGKRGRIVIQKTKADGSTPLAGAHFQLWDVKKEHVLREGTVDEHGQIIFGGLPYGDYKLVETKAPKGYTIADEFVTGKLIKISAATTAADAKPLVVVNEPNKVILKKVDEQGNLLAGARFKLEKLSTEINGSSFWQDVPLLIDQTNEQGILEVDSLASGMYRFVETFAPAGVIRNDSPHVFLVYQQHDGQIPEVHVTMTNYRGRASLVKKDEQGNPLFKATFKVVDENGKDVAGQSDLISDDKGVVTATNLAPGKYQFIETKAPAGYILNTTPVDFVIEPNHDGKPEVVNASDNFINYKGSAQLQKKDAKGNPLAQAIFKVVDAKGNTVARNLVSNAKGVVTVTNLAPGNYQFVETKAPDGFLLNDQTVPFKISEKQQGKPHVVVASADFINYQGAFKIRKVNSSKKVLKGAEFTLYDSQKQKLTQGTSDENGQVQFNKLAPGTYYFQETKAPQNDEGNPYVLNPALVKVEIPTHYTGNPQVINFGDFQNFKGKAVIKKVGSGGSIAGTTFDLFRMEDGEENLERRIVVPDSGELDLDNLGVGSYKLVETKAAPGYVINNQPIYFVVQKEGENDQIDQLDFENYQAEFIAHKQNEAKELLAGATFAVFAAKDKQPIGEALPIFDHNGNEIHEITTDETGEIYGKGLPAGDYVLIETKAPQGYMKDTTPKPFTISDQQGKPEILELGDVINYKGSALLEKVDEQGEPLADAVFAVKDAAGKTVAKDLVTDKKGQIQVKDLVPGNYQFIETKSPKGYLLNTTATAFTISAENAGQPSLVKVTMKNYKGSVAWQKTDEHGHALSGAVFNIFNEDGAKLIATADKNGKVALTNLAPGNYTIKETQAPKGYQLSEKTYSFVIPDKAAGKPETVKLAAIINHKLPPKPNNKEPNTKETPPKNNGKIRYPKTNDQHNQSLVIIGLIILGAVAVYFWKRKK